MKELVTELTPFFKKYKKRYSFGILAMFFSNIAILVPPYLVGKVLDELFLKTLTSQSLLYYTVFFLSAVIFSYAAEIFWGFQFFGGSNLLSKELREKLMRHFLNRKAIFYEQFRTGDLMARATNDLNAVSEMAGYGIMVTMDSTVYLGFVIGMMFFTVSGKLTLVSMFPIPILAYLLFTLGGKVNKRYLASQDAFAEVNDDVLEGIEGVRVVRAYAQEDTMTDNFKEKTNKVLEKNISVAQINASFAPLIKVLMGVSYVIAFGYGGTLIARGDLSVGKLVSFQVYLSM